jgi:hypothetical protein
VQELKDENGRLFRLLNEKDMEIQKMKKKKNDEKTRIMGKLLIPLHKSPPTFSATIDVKLLLLEDRLNE